MSVLLISNDLMLGSQLRPAANQAGITLAVKPSPAQLLTAEPPAGVKLVIVDLAAPGLDVTALVGAISAWPARPTVIAFGPHVHKAKLAAARKAGCDQVLSRGEMVSGAGALMARYAPGAP